MKSELISAVAVFAEDIRQEAEGTVTLVGIAPDNIQIDAPPAQPSGAPPMHPVMAKLAVYARCLMSLGDTTGGMLVTLTSPSGKVIAQTEVDQGFIDHEMATAKSQSAPHMTVVSQIVAAPFPILEEGQFSVTVHYEGVVRTAGFVNFHFV